MKAALLAPLALLAICTLGLVSGVLAAPMHVHPVAVSRGESPTTSLTGGASYDTTAAVYVDDGQCFWFEEE